MINRTPSWLAGAGAVAGLASILERARGNKRSGLRGHVVQARDTVEGFVKGLGYNDRKRSWWNRFALDDQDLVNRLRGVATQLGLTPERKPEARWPQRTQQVQEQSMGTLIFSWLGAMGLGAVLMYLLDPVRGNRRRSLIRDQVIHSRRAGEDFLAKAGRDLQNRSSGLIAQARSLFTSDEPSDRVVAARVRQALGLVVSHPRAISVTVHQGNVTLRGPILADEVDGLIRRLVTVPGVNHIDNQLEVHQEPGNVPGLQGAGQRREPQFELLQENWTPGIRLLTGLGGAALALSGLRRGGLRGLFGAIMGLGLALRGLTNKPIKQLVGASNNNWAVDIQKAINVDAPVEEAFEFWANYENFPRFMSNIEEIRDLGNGQSHWVVKGPAGTTVEWDATLTDVVPNEMIAWRTQPGATVDSAGVVQFEPNKEGGTRINVRMSYNPPGGVAGHAVATLFGSNPKQDMDEDLVRLKSLIEHGKTTSEGETVTRQEFSVPSQ